MLPVVTVIGIEAAFLMGGLIVTETVFNIPGVARFLVEAIRWRDYPIVQNLVMFIAIVAVSINFLVDLLYAVLDPRIKLFAEGAAAWRASISSRGSGAPVSTRAESVWSKLRYHAAAHPLGVVGAAHHGRCSCSPRSLPTSSRPTIRSAPIPRIALAPPSARHWLGADSDGPRYLQPHRLRRAHFARRRPGLDLRSAASSASCSGSPRAISAAGSIW